MVSHAEWLRQISTPVRVPLKVVIQHMHQRVRRRRVLDCFTILLGDEGAGKTDLGILIGRLLDRKFTADRVAYTQQDFMDLARRRDEIPRGSVILIDEGALLAFNLDYAKGDAKDLVKYLMAFRERGLIVLLAIQRKRRLLPSVEERGHLLFITKEQGDHNSRTWIYRNPGSNQFSKKGTRWLYWTDFKWGPITPDHPAWKLKLSCKAKKEATVDRLGDEGAGHDKELEELDLESDMENQVRAILAANAVKVQ